MSVYRDSDRSARKYARMALLNEQPQEYQQINLAALEWARFKISLWGFLTLFFLVPVVHGLIAYVRGTQILNIALALLFAVLLALTIKHYASFKRRLIAVRSDDSLSMPPRA